MRQIPNNIKRFYYWMIDLLSPPSCISCGKLETWLCEDCATKIPLLKDKICQRCGQRWDKGPICRSCQQNPLKVAPIRSAFAYNDTIRQLVHALKYRGATEILKSIKPQLQQSWQYYNLSSDLLVPVPLHKAREKKRGYNQSWLIAQTLGKMVNIPSQSVLIRTRNTASQTKLNKAQRQKNVEAAFTCAPDTEIQDKCITLVDDVATTGATLDACAVILFSNGAKAVSAFTLARAT